MTEQKHTPGPWMVVDDHVCASRYGETVVASPVGDTQEEAQANAALIAAAPDLLSAAERLSALAEQILIRGMSNGEARAMRDAYAALDAAISKATGQDGEK